MPPPDGVILRPLSSARVKTVQQKTCVQCPIHLMIINDLNFAR